MQKQDVKSILIWLPSPLGDAILSTPAQTAIRSHFDSARITFISNSTVKSFLEPTGLCDQWIETGSSFWATVKLIRQNDFDAVILFKNSFSSALTVFLAGIPHRIGYARDGRSIFLNDTLRPQKNNGQFVPVSAADYYLVLARHIGAAKTRYTLSLSMTDQNRTDLNCVYPELNTIAHPLVILVPGGAFGPSKLWPIQRYAELADRLFERYHASVVISVAPTPPEKSLAERIRKEAKYPMLSLSDRPLKPGPLKALYEKASLVITNDTGPRHIAAALGKRIITLFGPNNPAWTDTGYAGEIQIVGQAPCVPCDKPQCLQDDHYCMKSISVDRVFEAAGSILEADFK